MGPNGLLQWSISDLAGAMGIQETEVTEYFTDGRKVSFILERRLAREILKGGLAPSEGASFDVLDEERNKWEVRSITGSGVYFCPSYMVGSGRRFDPLGFIEKLDGVKGYVLADVEAFPCIPFWMIENYVVRQWWGDDLLGKTTKISRKRAMQLLENL